MSDPWLARPDLKPFPAMVDEPMSVTERTALETHYQSFRNQRYAESEKKKSAWYRLVFPLSANFAVKENPWAHTHKENVYNPATCYYTNAGT